MKSFTLCKNKKTGRVALHETGYQNPKEWEDLEEIPGIDWVDARNFVDTSVMYYKQSEGWFLKEDRRM